MKICTWSRGVLPGRWTERPFGILDEPHQGYFSRRGSFSAPTVAPVKKAAVEKQLALGELPPSSSVASFAIWRETTRH